MSSLQVLEGVVKLTSVANDDILEEVRVGHY